MILILAYGPTAEGHGAHDGLVAEYTAELVKNPTDSSIRHQLAAAYVNHGDGELALEELAKFPLHRKTPVSLGHGP
ncbi:MAG: hypothetical protein HC767_13160 [Akkermansiaceae bacterium]|nr:hypothetical protein [Akkermansiaceae bacterium]